MSHHDETMIIALATWGVTLAMTLVSVIAMVRILHRTGYSGWWLLTSLVPLLNIVMLWKFSTAAWPAAGLARNPASRASVVPPPRPPAARAQPQRGPAPAAQTATPEPPNDYVF